MLPVGTPAPEFVLRDQNNQEVQLSSFRGARNVLLVFYPYAFTGTCHSELCSIRDHLNDFVNESTQVLSISVDTVFAHKVWATQEGFEFPLLADFWPHGSVAQSYDVFDFDRGCARRATFIVDKTGIIRFAEVSPSGARDQDNWRKVLASL